MGARRIGLNVEPISPEIVLVDPDLAGDDRTWLREPAWRQAAANGTLRKQLPRRAPTPARLRVPPAGWRGLVERAGEHAPLVLLAISLLANGVLTAVVLSRSTTAVKTVAVVAPPPVSSVASARKPARAQALTPVGSRIKTKRAVPQLNPKPQKQTTPRKVAVHETRVEVERKILRLLIQSPAGKLPGALIDATTGLAKNNLQAVCRLKKPTVYRCVVRPSRHEPQEGLTIRYRVTRDGRGVVTWGRYRNG